MDYPNSKLHCQRALSVQWPKAVLPVKHTCWIEIADKTSFECGAPLSVNIVKGKRACFFINFRQKWRMTEWKNVQWCSYQNHQIPVYDMKWDHFDRVNFTFKMLLSSWNFDTVFKKIRSFDAENLGSVG